MAKYSECKELADKIRAQANDMLVFADFIQTHGVKLDRYDLPYVSAQRTYDVWLTEQSSTFNEKTEKYESKIDEIATKQKMRRFLNALRGLGRIEKDYTDDTLTIKMAFGEGNVSIVGRVDRQVACTKKVVERKWIEPKTTTTPGRYEEVVEWDCETPSLLALVKED